MTSPAPAPDQQPAKTSRKSQQKKRKNSGQKTPKKTQPNVANEPFDLDQTLDLAQWESLQRELAPAAPGYQSAQKCFSDDAEDGAIYRWGIACAAQDSATPLQEKLARLACEVDGWETLATQTGGRPDRSTANEEEREFWLAEADRFDKRVFSEKMSVLEAVEAVMWAAAMPGLSRVLPHEVWWRCAKHLRQLHQDASSRSDVTSGLHLLLAGELGLTLAWRLKILPACEEVSQSSRHAVGSFLQGEGESIDRVLAHPNDIRLVVASLIRCEKLFPCMGQGGSKKLKKREREIAAEFVTWLAALARHDATQVFSRASPEQCRIDYPSPTVKKKTSKRSRSNEGQPELHGLMKAACQFDPGTLAPALAAALGQSHSGGRLAWEVSLPEAMWHSETGKCAVMLPEWDVRRGRTFLDYSGEDVNVETMGGRHSLFQGPHQTMIALDGVDQSPQGGWQCTCEYSDDDVHMLELEQHFTGGIVLQRQWMLVRDDRCLMVSDAVLPEKQADWLPDNPTPSAPTSATPAPEIQCVSRLPLAADVEVIEDSETRELILHDARKHRAMVMPLAAGEWRVGPTACECRVSEDRHLVVTTRGRGALYSPVWLDFQRRRFQRKRTWRQLTIAENLTILPRHTAAAFRIQVGSEHWVVYRSLFGRTARSVMGKHLIADFFAARFHPGDGGMEELVTVDDTSENE